MLRSATGQVSLHETDRIPSVEGIEFGWVIQLGDREQSVRWRESLSGPDGSAEVRGGINPTSTPQLSGSWVVEAGDPAGRYQIEIDVDGEHLETFEFELQEPLAVGSFGHSSRRASWDYIEDLARTVIPSAR